jgi:hypothetical protein
MPTHTSPSTFASLSFHWTDKLRFINFPAAAQTSIAEQIRASWPRGIQKEQVYAQHAYEYKLKGRPFGASGAKEAVGSRRLVRDILALLHRSGWVLLTPVSHNRQAGSKDTLIFRRQRVVRQDEEGQEGMAVDSGGKGDVLVPPPVDWLVIAPARGDRLRVICDKPVWRDGTGAGGGPVKQEEEEEDDDDDDDEEEEKGGRASSASRSHDHDELGVLIRALKQAFAELDYFQSGQWTYDSFEFKLKGFPWAAVGDKRVKAERLLLAVVETLDGFGWRSYATVRQRSESEDVRKADTWLFVREEGWVHGSPFNGE